MIAKASASSLNGIAAMMYDCILFSLLISLRFQNFEMQIMFFRKHLR